MIVFWACFKVTHGLPLPGLDSRGGGNRWSPIPPRHRSNGAGPDSPTRSFAAVAPPGAGKALAFDGSPVTMSSDAKAQGTHFDKESAGTRGPSVLGDSQPQQGYHVKLTVSTGQAGDNGVKHKVFW